MTKKISMANRLLITILMASIAPSLALADCTLLQNVDDEKPFYQNGQCDERASPASTFKIPLAIIGYDAGILKSAQQPVWSYKPGMPYWIESWKQDQTPRSWIQNSVVWYSQELAQQLGESQIENALKQFQYGNANVSDKNGEAGLERAWLNGTTQISPKEQAEFIVNLVQGKWSKSEKELDFLKSIFRLDDEGNGWTIYGKTGASGFNAVPEIGKPYRIGWFVGWMEKGNRKIVFVNFGQQTKANVDVTGTLLKKEFLKNLPQTTKLIENNRFK